MADGGFNKRGFLVKEGGSWKSWKKRYFVLKDGQLHYSQKPSKGSLGTIDLRTAKRIEPVEYKKKDFCFSMETPTRTWYMCAESEAERTSWVEILCKERDRLQGKIVAKEGRKEAKPISMEDFDLLRVIGRGSFGKVFQVRQKSNGQIYAMKVLNKKAIIARGEVAHTLTEKNILTRLVHPFLVNLYYTFQTADKLCFVMDFVNGGELFAHLQKEKKFSESRTRFYCAEIALGLEYLHSNGVIYRDLKPENLLLTEDGHICMTDFGISKEGLLCEDDRTSTFCGTPEYLAPEVLQGIPYGKAIDWWSLGTLMYEMLVGLPPFYSKDVQLMYKKILTTELKPPSNVSQEACSLLFALLQRDPARRIQEARQIKAHPWFRGIDWDKLLAKEVPPPYVPPVKGKEEVTMIADEFKEQKVEMTQNSATMLSDVQQALFRDFDSTK